MNNDNRSSDHPIKDSGFYQSKAWRAARKLALQRDHYLCQLRISPNCTRKATTVHHIKELEDFPELALDMDNLTSCCYNCHELTKDKGDHPKLPEGVRIIKV